MINNNQLNRVSDPSTRQSPPETVTQAAGAFLNRLEELADSLRTIQCRAFGPLELQLFDAPNPSPGPLSISQMLEVAHVRLTALQGYAQGIAAAL
jgi:hypothetical protein